MATGLKNEGAGKTYYPNKNCNTCRTSNSAPSCNIQDMQKEHFIHQ